MKMKKFVAASLPEAMKLIRKELGDDAIIMSQKAIYSKGFLGMFKKKSIEVVAGMDTQQDFYKPSVEPLPSPPQQTSDGSLEIKKELEDLKIMLKSIQRPSFEQQYPQEMKNLIHYLKEQELAEELITTVSDELFVLSKKQELSFQELAAGVERILLQQLADFSFGGITYQKKYINVLGPTGVGKTTTIAKIAARAVLEKKKKIGFITTDTYRIAAIEQLKTYAGLLQAPIEIIYNEADLKAATEKFAHLDIVFVDTAGRNYKEQKFVEDLESLVEVKHDSETFLVLSSTSKERDMESIIEQFQHFPIEKLIFTKLDETNSVGSLMNLMVKYKKGLAYYTDGQEVPEDIGEGTPKKVIDMLLKGLQS